MIFMLVAAAALLSADASLASVYRSARTYDKATFRFVPPKDEVRRRFRAVVAALGRAQPGWTPDAAVLSEARDSGFEIVRARDESGGLWIAREPSGIRAGGGLYVFRPGGTPMCIQAPHSFFDEGTGLIALALFARTSAGCLFVNTVHRYSPSDGAGEHLADVAHAERTMFTAAHEGLLDSGRWAIIQLHGFGARDDLPGGTRAVVSDGNAARPPTSLPARLGAALGQRLGGKASAIAVFGRDTEVLGATTNVQGRLARHAGAPFLHIEMSADLRRALQGDVEPLAAALVETLSPARR